MSIHDDPIRQGNDEPELDPAAERVRQKLAKLLLGSLGVMVLGLLAVFAAILYKVRYEPGNGTSVVAADPSFPIEGVAARITVPAGAQIVSTSLDGERALLQLQFSNGAGALWLLDLPSGGVLGRYELQPE